MSDKCHFKNVLMNLPFMCLNYIIAHETYQLYLALPFKPAYMCFIKQRGTSRTQEFKCKFVFLVYQLQCLEFGGVQYTVGKVLKIPFQRYITRPKMFKKYNCKRKIHSRLVTV